MSLCARNCGAAARIACGTCRGPRYCGAACRKADWPRHKPQCLAGATDAVASRANPVAARANPKDAGTSRAGPKDGVAARANPALDVVWRACARESCGARHIPYKMHRCPRCGILYCDAECSVKNWRRHKHECASIGDVVFTADVAYGLRASHLTTCVVCECGCARPAVDPRVVALGLGPVTVVRACNAATGAPNAASIASALDQQTSADIAAFGASLTKIQEAVGTGRYTARLADVAQLWTDARVLFKTAYHGEARPDQMSPERARLLESLRAMSPLGLYIASAVDAAQPSPATHEYVLAFTALAHEIERAWGI